MPLQSTNSEVFVGSVGFTPDGQTPDIATLADGRLIVVWTEELTQPTSDFSDTDGAVFARIFDADGTPLDDAFQVNDWEPFLQNDPQVVALSTGGFTIGWTSRAIYGDHTYDNDVFLKTYNADAEPTGKIQTMDLVVDGAGDVEDGGQQLLEMVSLSRGRVGISIDYGDGGSIFHVAYPGTSSFTLKNSEQAASIVGNADMVQLSNGNILRAFALQDSVVGDDHYDVVVTLSDAEFGTPDGSYGIYDELEFWVYRNKDMQKADIELAALAGGGFAMAYIEEIDAQRSAIQVDIITEFGQIEFRKTAIIRNFSFDDASSIGDFDMIGLSDGGLAMATVTLDANGVSTGIDMLFLDEDGKVLTQIQASATDKGSQSAPSLSETDDGRVALVFSDTSGTKVDGEADPLHIAFFEQNGDSGKFYGTEGDDILAGLGGNDKIFGYGGDDEIYGRRNDDILKGGDGDDALYGGSGNDALRGNDGKDTLSGGNGNDGLNGGAGRDRLYGDDGTDVLDGGSGKDYLDGGIDNDKLRGNDGNDTLIGDEGNDRLRGQEGDDLLEGGNGADWLFGGTDSDTLNGGAGSDVLKGNGGSDVLMGNGGSDTLIGGAGTDTLIGGSNDDSLTGSGGSDVFEFSGTWGKDTITDFTTGGTDLIRFETGNGEAETFAEFKKASTKQGSDLLYDLDADGTNTILLEDIALADLSAADFEFV